MVRLLTTLVQVGLVLAVVVLVRGLVSALGAWRAMGGESPLASLDGWWHSDSMWLEQLSDDMEEPDD